MLESTPDESTLVHKPFRIPKYVWDHLQQEEAFQNLRTKGLLGEKFADVEEKYDLTQVGEGFGEKSEDGEDVDVTEESTEETGEEGGAEEV